MVTVTRRLPPTSSCGVEFRSTHADRRCRQSAPYATAVDTGAYPAGQHVLRARASDAAGNLSPWASALVQFGGSTTHPSGFTRNESWVTGLTGATAFAQAPDGRLFIAQQGGALRVVKNGALLATPFATVAVDSAGERGLIGVALHPAFASNGWVYIYATRAAGGVSHSRISRFTAAGDVVAAGSEVVLVDLPNLSGATTTRGGMHFGSDGKLYVGVGDNANGAQAKNLALPFGKLLRFNDDGTIPGDNPFAASRAASAARSGLRPAQSLHLRGPAGTGTIHITTSARHLGRDRRRSAGANYGWPASEARQPRRRRHRAALRLPAQRRHPLGSGRADSSRASPSPAVRSIRAAARFPRSTATSTTSPTSSASSSAESISPTATPRTRSPASRFAGRLLVGIDGAVHGSRAAR